MSAPSPAPAGRVTALTSTGFTVTMTAVPTSGYVELDVRALGSAASWTLAAGGNSLPAVGDTLAATGLTTGTAYEWRLLALAAVSTPLWSEGTDGTHGIITPSTSIWGTLLTTVGTALSGAGVVGIYYGGAPLDSHDALTAVIRAGADTIAERGNNILTRAYPVEVEVRIRSTSSTGAQHYTDTAKWQRQLVTSFNERDLADYPSITGLEVIRVETRETDAVGPGHYSNEARAVSTVTFYINEAR